MIKLNISVTNLTTPESVGVNCEGASLELEIPVEEIIEAMGPLHTAGWTGMATLVEKILTPEVTKLIEDQFKPPVSPELTPAHQEYVRDLMDFESRRNTIANPVPEATKGQTHSCPKCQQHSYIKAGQEKTCPHCGQLL